jgi:hypothetical protein
MSSLSIIVYLCSLQTLIIKSRKKVFKHRRSSLRTHERRRHGVGLTGSQSGQGEADPGSVSASDPSKGSNTPTLGRSHVCEVCGKAFFTRQTLQVTIIQTPLHLL